MSSKIYNSILITDLILGVPQVWFYVCFFSFLIPYTLFHSLFGSAIFMLVVYLVGRLLTKIDPDFIKIFFEKAKYLSDGISFRKPKIYHD